MMYKCSYCNQQYLDSENCPYCGASNKEATVIIEQTPKEKSKLIYVFMALAVIACACLVLVLIPAETSIELNNSKRIIVHVPDDVLDSYISQSSILYMYPKKEACFTVRSSFAEDMEELLSECESNRDFNTSPLENVEFFNISDIKSVTHRGYAGYYYIYNRADSFTQSTVLHTYLLIEDIGVCFDVTFYGIASEEILFKLLGEMEWEIK